MVKATVKKSIYCSAGERAEYNYGKYIRPLKVKHILDIGCGYAYLRKHIGEGYIGVDIAGEPDIFMSLESGRLPFKDNSFDCVVCTDVLEHLESIHDVFFELTRVTRRYAIISLPNCWGLGLSLQMLKGKGSMKAYGLPIKSPKEAYNPEQLIDRHKWFFNYEDAKNFIYGMAKRAGMDVVICEPYCPFKIERPFLSLIARIIYGSGDRFNNVFAGTLWAFWRRNKCYLIDQK